MRNPTFHLMAAGLVLALCGCNDDTPELKKSAPANPPAAPAAKPPAPMTTKPAPKATKPTPAPAPATAPAQPTAKTPATTEPMQSKPVTPATTPTTPSATTEPLGATGTPSTPATTEPLAGGQVQTPAPGSVLADAALPITAIARLSPTSGSEVRGTVTFTSTGTGVRVQISLTGLTPGEHGFHIHEKGDCSAPDAASAGEHFSTRPEPHAGPQDTARHTGDLGNVTADAQGRVETSFIDERIALTGEDSILQRSVVVHADKDDLSSQPVGNSGARLACGVIEAETPPATQPGSAPGSTPGTPGSAPSQTEPMDQPSDQPK